MIDYLSVAKDDFKRLFFYNSHLADIEDALNLAEKLRDELYALVKQLESCIYSVKNRINEYDQKINAAQNKIRQAEASANAVASELARTPHTKKVATRQGEPPREVPANQEKISALKEKMYEENQKAEQYRQEASRLQAKLNIFRGDLQALLSSETRLNGNINDSEMLISALKKAFANADTQSKDYVLRDIERAGKLMEAYSRTVFKSFDYGAVSMIREKE